MNAPNRNGLIVGLLLVLSGLLPAGCAWFGADGPLKPLSYEGIEGGHDPETMYRVWLRFLGRP